MIQTADGAAVNLFITFDCYSSPLGLLNSVYGPGLGDLELDVRDTADMCSRKCSATKENFSENVFVLFPMTLRIFMKDLHSRAKAHTNMHEFGFIVRDDK